MALCSHPGDAMPQREVPLTLIIFAVMYRFYFQLDPCSAGSASAAEAEQSSRGEQRRHHCTCAKSVAVCEGMHGFPGEKEGAVTQYFMLLHHEQAAEANDKV